MMEATNLETEWSLAQRLEKKFSALMREPSASGTALEHYIIQLREKYESIIFLDMEYARQRDIEGRVWNVQHKVIERYREVLNKFQETNGNKKPVELRKLQDAFVRFIKLTTRFYRSFIQRLVAYFGIYELNWVIRKFNLEVSDVRPEARKSTIVHQVVRSCHCSLVFLGDLSRYREDPKSTKNWGPAIGYYSLANKLIPSSGAPHNQLAVISTAQGSRFSTIYHLYRAVCVSEPFPEASENLRLGFKKALKAHQSGKLESQLVRKEESAAQELISSFIRLHAELYRGKEFSDHEALESETLTQLALSLKDRTLSSGMLTNLVLINIAAQGCAAKRAIDLSSSKSHNRFLRLNVATFTTLHQVFQPELERAASDKTESDVDNISAVGRRMLPSLRLYSTWLRNHHFLLTERAAGTAFSVLIKQLWQTYANTLSLLAATFSESKLPRLGYLEEDNDTIGFEPFQLTHGNIKTNWLSEEKSGSLNVHPNDEILARIRLLLADGRQLCLKESIPITIADNSGMITYTEKGILANTPSIGMNSPYTSRSGGPPLSQSTFLRRGQSSESPTESVYAQGGSSIVDSVTGSETMTIQMNNMVDSLVGPPDEPSSDEDDLHSTKCEPTLDRL